MLDFNRTNVSTSPLSVAINELIELADWPEVNTRKSARASVQSVDVACRTTRWSTRISSSHSRHF